ncbi:MAG TPA: gliding motility-associated protein GldE [Candidatus Alistipes pullicola]|nr:gliding motility-associated protein GldE [Candidatus Alistipes pullicola]
MSSVVFNTFTFQDGVILSLIVLLLCISAIVSASETAFFSLSPHDIERFKKNKDRTSKMIITLLSAEKYLLATILITNNLVNVCIVVLANGLIDSLIDFGDASGWEFLIKMVVVTFLLLLFGEIMPKIFSSYNPIRIAKIMALPLSGLKSLFKPFAYLLIHSGNYISKKFSDKHDNISIDELSNAIEMTSDQNAEEKQMLSEIVDFVHTEVGEIMKPRLDIVALDLKSNFEEVRQTIVSSGFSRIPVFEENIDKIKGILYVKDLLPYITKDKNFEWQNLIRKPYFVPEHKKINELLEEFRTNQIHIAIVVDEYGSTLGLLSLEDILEEIVGEISDESDREQTFYKKLAPNIYLFDGKTHLNDFLEVLGLDDSYLDSVKGEAETIAGLMLEIRKDFLHPGESLTCRDLMLQVETVDGLRIDKIKVTLLSDPTTTR